MADMPSDFWSGWITVITVTGLLGLAWMVFSVYFSRADKKDESLVWDETLVEGFHAPPLWWFWLILAAMVCTVVYLILYPGLGSFAGVIRWSQAEHLHHSGTMYGGEFDDLRAKIASTPIETLQTDAAAMASAQRVFRQNCAACHGSSAQGQAQMFPNLRDSDWQWGGEPKQIEQTIRMGRQALMPPHGAVVSAAELAELASYVSALSSGRRTGSGAPGHELFERNCSPCHGLTATGNAFVGAPNLTDDIWLYGGSKEALTHTIANGRNGIMPSFEKRLDDTQIRLLVAWLLRDQNGRLALKAADSVPSSR